MILIISQVLVRLLTPALISLALWACFSFVIKEQTKELGKKPDKMFVVHLPKAYFWTGTICTICFCLFLVLAILFPNGTATWWVYIGITAFVLLGIFIIWSSKVWAIWVYKNTNYFVYRTCFGKRYKILYHECLSFKLGENSLVLRTEKRCFIVDVMSINLEHFVYELRQNKVKQLF